MAILTFTSWMRPLDRQEMALAISIYDERSEEYSTSEEGRMLRTICGTTKEWNRGWGTNPSVTPSSFHHTILPRFDWKLESRKYCCFTKGWLRIWGKFPEQKTSLFNCYLFASAIFYRSVQLSYELPVLLSSKLSSIIFTSLLSHRSKNIYSYKFYLENKISLV